MHQRSLPFTVFLLVLVMLLAACQPLRLEDAAGHALASTTTIHEFPFEETNVVEGTLSTLERTAEGVHIKIATADLVPGDAYTLWWVVFNYPNECSAEGCIPQNFIEAKVAAMVKYGVGAIADENGTAVFESFLSVGDIEGAVDNQSGFDFAVLEPAPGLTQPLTAEFHVVLRSHGAALPDPTEQLTTFNGGCNPECYNAQIAMHVPNP